MNLDVAQGPVSPEAIFAVNNFSLLLVGLEPGERTIAIAAAQSLRPEATVTDLKDLDEFARASAGLDRGLVVIASGNAGQVAQAIHAADDSGLPRWAVVVMGETSPDEAAGFVPRGDWNVRSAAQVFRASLALHAARRENARLRGDLKTVATRFSHDVRSPVGAILTTCELMKELGDVPDAALVRVITDSTDEISRLVERLTIVLRATADPKAGEMVDMGDLVFRALERIQYECHQKQASVVVPEKWPLVRGVARNLEVVWDCLLANAIKHGGESPRIRGGWMQTARDYEFWVEDGGTLPPGLHAKLLAPFHTLHRQHDGGGLDLAIARRLVELHGGRCVFEPLPGAGSRFLFTLPVTTD